MTWFFFICLFIYLFIYLIIYKFVYESQVPVMWSSVYSKLGSSNFFQVVVSRVSSPRTSQHGQIYIQENHRIPIIC